MRGIAVWVLVVVGSFLTLTSILNVWAERQILSNSGWTQTSDRLLADPDVRAAAANALVEQVGKNVNLQQLLAKRFPRAASVAPIAQVQIQELAKAAAEDALASPAAARAWRRANAITHSRAVAVLRGHELANGAVTTENGKFVLDLTPVVQTLRGRLGIRPGSDNPDAGKIVLFSESGLKKAQFGVSIIDALSAWLAFVALGLFAGAVWLARPARRRGVVLGIGATLFGMGLALLVLRRIAIHALAPKLARTDIGEKAVVDAAQIVTSLLRDTSLFILLLGLAALVWTWLAGESGPARSLRRAIAPVARKRPVVVHLGVLLLLLLLLLWGPTGTVRRVSGVLVLLAIILVGTEAFRRQAVREFPDAEAVSIQLPGRSREPSFDERLASLERLGALHEKGVLTDEEFARSKEQLLVGGETAPLPAPGPPSEQA